MHNGLKFWLVGQRGPGSSLGPFVLCGIKCNITGSTQYATPSDLSMNPIYSHSLLRPGAIGVADIANHPVTYWNQLEQEETYEYNTDSRLQTLVRFDTSLADYIYYDSRWLETLTDGWLLEFTYYANGRFDCIVSNAEGIIAYTYNLAADISYL